MTLSAYDMHWDDLATVLLSAKRRVQGLPLLVR